MLSITVLDMVRFISAQVQQLGCTKTLSRMVCCLVPFTPVCFLSNVRVFIVIGRSEEECVKLVVESLTADARDGVIDVQRLEDLIDRLESDDFLERMCRNEIEFLQTLLNEMERPLPTEEDWANQMAADLDLSQTPNFSLGGMLWESSSDENDSDDDKPIKL
jgi:hypothetical protein